MNEIDDVVDGMPNGFIRNPTRNTRQKIEAYLESVIPGKWDEWNVRMTKLEWDREDRIARELEHSEDIPDEEYYGDSNDDE